MQMRLPKTAETRGKTPTASSCSRRERSATRCRRSIMPTARAAASSRTTRTLSKYCVLNNKSQFFITLFRFITPNLERMFHA